MNDLPDLIAVGVAKIFIIVVFILGMISLAIELYTGSLPL
jgi:hypothetical protein